VTRVVIDERFEIDREQFVRQRRFLIALSMVLFAKYAVGIEVGDSVEALGLQLTFKRKDVLLPFAWVVWLWALVRYFQYGQLIGAKALWHETVRETHRQAEKIFRSAVRDQIRVGRMHEGFKIEGKVGDMFWPGSKDDMKIAQGASRDHVAEYTSDPNGGRKYSRLLAQIRLSNGGEIMIDAPTELNAAQLRSCERRAWWVARIKTHVFTDYLAPYAVAGAAVVAGLAAEWPWIASTAQKIFD
jgi:hypothetical protein